MHSIITLYFASLVSAAALSDCYYAALAWEDMFGLPPFAQIAPSRNPGSCCGLNRIECRWVMESFLPRKRITRIMWVGKTGAGWLSQNLFQLKRLEELY